MVETVPKITHFVVTSALRRFMGMSEPFVGCSDVGRLLCRSVVLSVGY
jgi:hypothetical protein